MISYQRPNSLPACPIVPHTQFHFESHRSRRRQPFHRRCHVEPPDREPPGRASSARFLTPPGPTLLDLSPGHPRCRPTYTGLPVAGLTRRRRPHHQPNPVSPPARARRRPPALAGLVGHPHRHGGEFFGFCKLYFDFE
jgi:hypothetical protein